MAWHERGGTINKRILIINIAIGKKLKCNKNVLYVRLFGYYKLFL